RVGAAGTAAARPTRAAPSAGAAAAARASITTLAEDRCADERHCLLARATRTINDHVDISSAVPRTAIRAVATVAASSARGAVAAVPRRTRSRGATEARHSVRARGAVPSLAAGSATADYPKCPGVRPLYHRLQHSAGAGHRIYQARGRQSLNLQRQARAIANAGEEDVIRLRKPDPPRDLYERLAA